MSSIHTAKKVSHYVEPRERGINGCHNCTRVQMQPSLSGPRAPYCPKLGCWVKEMSICDQHNLKPAAAHAEHPANRLSP